MRVIMRSTAHRYPRGRLARAERSGRSLGAREEERRKVKRSGKGSETRQKEKQENGREKEEDEVARRRQRTDEEEGKGGSSYTPYDGVGMRESALGRLWLEWRVWYVTMRAR